MNHAARRRNASFSMPPLGALLRGAFEVLALARSRWALRVQMRVRVRAGR